MIMISACDDNDDDDKAEALRDYANEDSKIVRARHFYQASWS